MGWPVAAHRGRSFVPRQLRREAALPGVAARHGDVRPAEESELRARRRAARAHASRRGTMRDVGRARNGARVRTGPLVPAHGGVGLRRRDRVSSGDRATRGRPPLQRGDDRRPFCLLAHERGHAADAAAGFGARDCARARALLPRLGRAVRPRSPRWVSAMADVHREHAIGRRRRDHGARRPRRHRAVDVGILDDLWKSTACAPRPSVHAVPIRALARRSSPTTTERPLPCRGRAQRTGCTGVVDRRGGCAACTTE